MTRTIIHPIDNPQHEKGAAPSGCDPFVPPPSGARSQYVMPAEVTAFFDGTYVKPVAEMLPTVYVQVPRALVFADLIVATPLVVVADADPVTVRLHPPETTAPLTNAPFWF